MVTAPMARLVTVRARLGAVGTYYADEERHPPILPDSGRHRRRPSGSAACDRTRTDFADRPGDFHRQVPVVQSILALCGLFSLSAGIRSLDEARGDQGLSLGEFLRSGGASLSLLVMSLLLLSAAYLAVIWEIADQAKRPTP